MEGALFPVSEVERTDIGSVAERICARVGTRAHKRIRGEQPPRSHRARPRCCGGEGEDSFEVNESSASLPHLTTATIYRRRPLIISRVTRIRARTRRPPARPHRRLPRGGPRPARARLYDIHPLKRAWTDGLLFLNRPSLISRLRHGDGASKAARFPVRALYFRRHRRKLRSPIRERMLFSCDCSGAAGVRDAIPRWALYIWNTFARFLFVYQMQRGNRGNTRGNSPGRNKN